MGFSKSILRSRLTTCWCSLNPKVWYSFKVLEILSKHQSATITCHFFSVMRPTFVLRKKNTKGPPPLSHTRREKIHTMGSVT